MSQNTKQVVELSFTAISTGKKPAKIAVVTLNRPETANAFSGAMIEQLTQVFKSIAKEQDCRALVLRGHGKHFCAGADLQWMQEAAKLSYRDNFRDARTLTQMFEALYRLPIPTIAVVHGAVFGGAVGLIACCDISIAVDSAKFCLSEVKLGLLPAVILPYLARRMRAGALRRNALSGRTFAASDAKDSGLIDLICPSADVNNVLREEIKCLLAGGPEAQRELKALHQRIIDSSMQQLDLTAAAIAKARTSEEGQAGLKAFFAQQSSPWLLALPENWSAFDA